MLRKKIFSLLVVFVMVMSLSVSTAFADEAIENEIDSISDYTITIFVDRPLDNTTVNERYCIDVDTMDIGHTFLRLSDGTTVEYTGFYPKNGISKNDVLFSKNVTGKIVDDKNHPWDVAKVYTVKKAQYDKVKSYIKSHKTDKYNIETYNCSTFAAGALSYAGIKTYKKNTWKIPSGTKYDDFIKLKSWKGYNPADLAYQIRAAGYCYYNNTSSGSTAYYTTQVVVAVLFKFINEITRL
jgi:hypothetical protein